MVALSKKPLPTAPSDLSRAALAEAIEHLVPFAAAIENATSGLAKAKASLADAEARLEQARGDLQQARSDQTARSVARAARGEGPEPDGVLREARRAEADAGDDVEIARAIAASLQTALGESEYAARRAKARVDEAAKAILLAEVPRLKTWVLEAEAEHARRGEICAFVVGLIPRHDFNPERNSLSFFAEHHASITGSRDKAAALPWAEALEALQTNASAPLPSLGAS